MKSIYLVLLSTILLVQSLAQVPDDENSEVVNRYNDSPFDDDDEIEDDDANGASSYAKTRRSGCHYVYWGSHCSDGCCYMSGECEDCRLKWYDVCDKYLLPGDPRGQMMSTANYPKADQSNWMSNFQRRTLKGLTLPGSHHAGVNDGTGSSSKDEWDITQKLSILDQLQAGIRFIDVSIATGVIMGRELRRATIVHNYKYQEFEFFFRDIVDFLKDHPTEVVVMSLKQGDHSKLPITRTSWGVNWAEVDIMLDRYKASIYKDRRSPLTQRIDQIKGKIIICHSSTHSRYFSMKCQDSWKSTNSFRDGILGNKMTQWLNSLSSNDGSNFYTLAAYLTPTYELIYGKCYRDGDEKLYDYSSLEDMAQTGNNEVYKWIKQYASKLRNKVSAIVMDFVNPIIIDKIISNN